MKLDRLASTTRPPSLEAAGHAQQAAGVRRIETAEATESDRQRSLQQELAAIEPEAVGEFHGGPRLLEEAHTVAMRIAKLGGHADALLNPQVLNGRLPHLDDNA